MPQTEPEPNPRLHVMQYGELHEVKLQLLECTTVEELAAALVNVIKHVENLRRWAGWN